jgi:hypothetical protein
MSDKLKTYGVDVEKTQTVRITLTIADIRRMVGAPQEASVSLGREMLRSTDKIEVVYTTMEAFDSAEERDL